MKIEEGRLRWFGDIIDGDVNGNDVDGNVNDGDMIMVVVMVI
jgi:hypothetical protein